MTVLALLTQQALHHSSHDVDQHHGEKWVAWCLKTTGTHEHLHRFGHVTKKEGGTACLLHHIVLRQQQIYLVGTQKKRILTAV